MDRTQSLVAESGRQMLVRGRWTFGTANRFCPMIGDVSDNGTEAATQTVSTRAGTVKELRLNVWSSASTIATDVTLRLNGADTALTVPIANGVTGILFDEADITIAEDDLLNYQGGAGPVGNVDMSSVVIEVEY